MQSSKDFESSQQIRESIDVSEPLQTAPSSKRVQELQSLEETSNPFIKNEGRSFFCNHTPPDRKIARIRPKYSIAANSEEGKKTPLHYSFKNSNFFENFESFRETVEPDSSQKTVEKKTDFDIPRTPRQAPRCLSPERRARLISFIPNRKIRLARNLETSKKPKGNLADSFASVQKISFAAVGRRGSFQLFEPESAKVKFMTRDLENHKIPLNCDNDYDTDSDQLTKSYNYYIKDFSQTFQLRQRKPLFIGGRRGSLEPTNLRPSNGARLSRTRETTRRAWIQPPPR